jgi:NAD(P)H dehydrogenase (quinone)
VSSATVLVLYYSRSGSTAELARFAARGVEAAGAVASVRTVPPVSPTSEATSDAIPASGPPYATLEDLRECDGLLLGSPTRFANMAAPLKYFLDRTSELWLDGTMADKPAGVFTSSSSPHGGQESTLLTMMLPLVHHGMLYVGVPYTENALFLTDTGGSPYGATHLARNGDTELSRHEIEVTEALGRRVGRLARALRGGRRDG